jgi:cell wall-associated NlpC family hydrolase
VQDALAQLGKPYLYGGTGPHGFDCAGLTQYAWRAAGVRLPRTSQGQAASGQAVNAGQLLPGDLVFYYPGRSHVALYVGSGMIIHAPHTGAFVRLSALYAMPISTVRRP